MTKFVIFSMLLSEVICA